MNRFINFIFVTFLIFASNMLFAQNANPASDFGYDLNIEGTGVVITAYTGEATDVIIPSVIEDFPVVALTNDAFYDRINVVSVVIPDSVVHIYGDSSGCFSGCKSLQKVKLPENLKYIPKSCFYKCEALKEITLSLGIEEIEPSSFELSGLESITIPDSVMIIDNSAFECCENLKTVTIGSGVNKIGYDAFRSCTSLTTVNMGDGLQYIGKYAFRECTALTTVTIGNGIKGIGSQAFYACSSLTKFNIGEHELKATHYDESGYTLSGFYIDGDCFSGDYCSYGYGRSVFEGCSSLSLKEKKKIRDTGYTDSF